MAFRLITQRIEHDARLDARIPACGVQLEHAIHVLGEVDDDGHVARLPGEAGPRAARQQRRVVLATDGDGGGHVLGIAGNQDTDGNLAVIRCVGRVQRAGAAVEPHLAAHCRFQRTREFISVLKGIDRLGMYGWDPYTGAEYAPLRFPAFS